MTPKGDLDWDAPVARQYRKYNEDGIIVVTFDDDTPTKITNDYHQPQLNFCVDREFWFGVSSKRLMNELKRYKPLTDKTFKITRHGSGIETTYNVKEVVIS